MAVLTLEEATARVKELEAELVSDKENGVERTTGKREALRQARYFERTMRAARVPKADTDNLLAVAPKGVPGSVAKAVFEGALGDGDSENQSDGGDS